jgi:23S rRNA pseudouridine2604 synthase
MRLNKHISDAGFCSRREADRLIAEGRVSVNGVRARIGAELGEDEQVRIDDKPLVARTAAKGQRRHIYIALNKPVGVTSTTESTVKHNIVDCVGHEQRIFPIGRLDKESEGLILLTSNGDIVNQILRAEHKLEKEYLAEINHAVTDDFLRGMARGGVPIHGERTLPCKTGKLGAVGFRIVLVQGLNRQIRLMAAHFGHRVKHLLRVRIGNVKLGHLKPGQWRNLTDAELRGLLPGHTDW